MLMKNNKNIFLYLILIFFSLIQSLAADEFDITALNIKLFQDSEKIQAEGNVLIVGQDGITIEAESATYDKKKNIIDAKKSVKITDTKTNNVLTSDKIQYLKNKEEIVAEGNDFFKDAKYNPRMKIDTKVSLVKYHPGYDPKLIENLIQTGCKAIIFEGTGLGHVGRTMYDMVKKAKENDLFLGMTSQCIDGSVRMTVYESGRDLLELGITPLENMTPETSLVKAMWASGNSKNADEMKSLMLENIASEF